VTNVCLAVVGHLRHFWELGGEIIEGLVRLSSMGVKFEMRCYIRRCTKKKNVL